MSENDDDMIGLDPSEQPILIRARMEPGEKLLAYATASIPPTGNLCWIPVVGSLLELNRVAGAKPFLLGVTNKRFLIIQYNRSVIIKKDAREVAFTDVPISQIYRCVAEKRFFDQAYSGGSLKLDLGNGQKYHFSEIYKNAGTMLRDAILLAQKG